MIHANQSKTKINGAETCMIAHYSNLLNGIILALRVRGLYYAGNDYMGIIANKNNTL